ncbi:MAG: hypothetical protein H6573_12215 [Lewinellaceae bacterium]|nr:hypothetical protein [Phaeodactylibacter sp.]MCB0612708.1 hypothetical protein [Phaeodactylibacter sp.]MCB9348256.1 hypothetical protein [Lewinellaceae bacterium]
MKDPQLTPEDEQRIENELKALNLELNHGATHFFASAAAPPELVSKFLDNVAKFEEAHAKGDLVSIRQFTQVENLPAADELDDSELEPRIETLLEQLEAKGIVIDRPEHLSARGYYRFLAEEFLQEKINNHAVPGMIHGFLYSELRHDGPEFIRDHVEETLLDLLNLGGDFQGEWLSEHCRNQAEAITKAEALESIHIFRSRYESITPVAFQPQEARRIYGAMYLFFGIAWEGRPLHGGEPERYEDMGISQVAWEDGEWRVQGLKIPGFEF